MKKAITTTALSLIALMASAQSAYINKVYEYCPAPGQFINELPEWEDGDDAARMAEKCTECLANNEQVMISLGGYGGYIVFGFDHTINNLPGHYDFKVLGNSFYATANPNPDSTSEGGSAEPGIVMVSKDTNGNGIPDDEWYELAGSEYYKPETSHDYTITYSRLDESKDTPWYDSEGNEGFIFRNSYHRQDYWPQWVDASEISFTGTKLANNAIDESGNGTYYVLYCYAWGYADNHPNNDAKNRSSFNIDWAVDSEGNHVQLDGIDFVKVYTAVNQSAGWLGETSTEVMGACDLHITKEDFEDEYYASSIHLPNVQTTASDRIYTIGGSRVNGISAPGAYIINKKKIIIK